MADFSKLDRILGAVDADDALTTTRDRPWVEDQAAANDVMAEFYERIGLKSPKFVWAKSPRVIHEAIEMLRRIHTGQRHNAIEALVPYNEDTLFRESQKTLLECLVDRDISVTMGASLRMMMPYSKNMERELGRLPSYLNHALHPQNVGQQTAPAGWSDVCMYSVGLPSILLAGQTFCVLAYKAVCWMCSPCKKHETEEFTVWTWGDGYTVAIKHEDLKEEGQTKILGDPAKPIASLVDHAAKVGKLLEGK